MRAACSSPRSEAGFALIGALWLSLALGLVGSLSLALAWRAVVRAELAVTEVEERLSMEGALVRAVHELGQQADHDVPFTAEYSLNGRTLAIEARPARAWPDLNLIEAVSLARFLEVLGADPGRAAALADTIADWREPEGLRRLNAATAEDYRRTGLPPPAHRPFRSTHELTLVHGLDPDEAACLAAHVTVFSDTAKPAPVIAAHPGLRLEGEPPRQPALAVRWTITAADSGRVTGRRATVLLASAPEQPVLVFGWGDQVGSARSECFEP